MSDTSNTLIKGYKYRIYPNKEQQEYLSKVFGCCRFIYNKMLNEQIKAYEEFKEGKTIVKPKISKFDMCKNMVKLKDIEDFVWLKEVPAHTLQASISNLESAFKHFFRKRLGYPKFKSKHGKQSATFSTCSYTLKDSVLKLAKCDLPIKVKWSRDLPTQFPGPVTISKTPDGKYCASFMCNYVPVKTAGTKITGIDAGITYLMTLSDGTSFDNLRHYVKASERLVCLQRRLSRKKKGSKNRNKARVKVAALHSKVVNQRNDYLHKLTTKLVSENQAIAIEQLMVSNMVKNHKLSKHILDASWGKMREYLKYKCVASNHCKLILADPYYPSTQLCSCCGVNPDEKIKLGVTKWTCSNCGTTHQRDDNAAKNLQNLAIDLIKTLDLFNKPEAIILAPAYRQTA